ncbi:hypothetical protein MVEN_01404300 [Mycena venus]|uniref:Uncharacterized protein n=1 Tax=Mycena venus TaxID=2733690 RepID=A0A8H6XVB7_9AGAR|nr:hypothetical protein MVEN_01404300 [Mycena venus]
MRRDLNHGGDSDDEYTNNGPTCSPQRKDGGTTTPQPTPTPSRSNRISGLVGGGARPRVRPDRHISFGAAPSASADDLLARAALEPPPTQLNDVSAADVERRARSGSIASHPEGRGETDQERRTRKEMRRLAAALAEPHAPEFEWFPGSGSGDLPQQLTFRAPPPGYNGIPSPFMRTPSPAHDTQPADALAHPAEQEDEDAADLDGFAMSSGRSSNSGSDAPYSPIGGHHPHSAASGAEITYVPIPPHKPKKSKSKSKSGRSTKSKSSTTSSTLASPPPTSSPFPHVRDSGVYPDSPKGEEFGAFTAAVEGQEDGEFDGTPSGLDSFDDFAEVQREALPSPGLSRGGGGFSFGGGKGMGGV